ncbi:MAG: hypothetical protein LLF90_00335 [Methanomicrobiaceae archaeon]|uniref:hypothetical protein n=1 Tax=Methanoculleus sp. TaxID=90427 RepID=UPI00320D0545|nr:hypothetical protein [Methanomicrobiaceae archaeon]
MAPACPRTSGAGRCGFEIALIGLSFVIYAVKYALFFGQWLVTYVEYLQRNYPYLFSLAMRSNPFDETASPVVR